MVRRQTLKLGLMLGLAMICNEAPSNVVGDADMKSLAQRSQEESKACDGPLQTAKQIGGEPSSATDAQVFSSKAITLKVADVLNSYPGFPHSSAVLLKKIIDTPESTQWDLSPFFNVKDCKTYGYFSIFKRLIESAKNHKLDATQKEKVRSVSLFYLKRDLQNPLTLLGVLVNIMHVWGVSQSRRLEDSWKFSKSL